MGLVRYAYLCVPSFVHPPRLAGNYGASRLRCLRESTHEACETVLDGFHALLCTQHAMRQAPQGGGEGTVQRGRARGQGACQDHAGALCQGAKCQPKHAEFGGQGHAARRVAEKMRERRQAAPFSKFPLAGCEETFRRAVDGRTCKGRKIGVFAVRSFMRRIRKTRGTDGAKRGREARLETGKSPDKAPKVAVEHAVVGSYN